MTKLNKITKSTFLVIVLSLILVAVLAFGGTYAYFTAEAKDAGTEVKSGKLKLANNAVSTVIVKNLTNMVPGQSILGENVTTIPVDTNIKYVARVKLEILSGEEDASADFDITTTGTAAETDGWIYIEVQESSVSELANPITGVTYKTTNKNDKQEKTYTIKLTVQLAQAEHVTGATTSKAIFAAMTAGNSNFA